MCFPELSKQFKKRSSRHCFWFTHQMLQKFRWISFVSISPSRRSLECIPNSALVKFHHWCWITKYRGYTTLHSRGPFTTPPRSQTLLEIKSAASLSRPGIFFIYIISRARARWQKIPKGRKPTEENESPWACSVTSLFPGLESLCTFSWHLFPSTVSNLRDPYEKMDLLKRGEPG